MLDNPSQTSAGATKPIPGRKIDPSNAAVRVGASYPPPFDKPCRERRRIRLGDSAGLTGFGVNLLTLPPGAWSSQRHWHSHEDEFIWVLDGEVTLVTNAGKEILRAGDCAGFKAGEPDGHHLVNRSDAPARVLEVGARLPALDRSVYPDIDLVAEPGRLGYGHRDGKPYGEAG